MRSMQGPRPNRSAQLFFKTVGVAIAFAAGLIPQAPLRAQSGADLTQILERLSKLEKANRELTDEVRTLRRELASNASRSTSPDVTAAQQNNWAPGDEERAPAISPVTVANGPTLE